MTPEQEIAHLRTANMALQRRLERARRDALLYAASLCEDHRTAWVDGEGWELVTTDGRNHNGRAYASKLKEIAR